VDSDGDGVPDGLEVKYGLDPLARNAGGLDTDGDGVSDAEEYRLGSNPIKRDTEYQDRNGFQYALTSEIQSDNSICYDFTISNVQLVTPPNRAGLRQGFNLFKLWFAQAPETSVAIDYGVWTTACVWAQYDPPSIRVPAGPSAHALTQKNFWSPPLLNTQEDESASDGRGCVGVSPANGQAGTLPGRSRDAHDSYPHAAPRWPGHPVPGRRGVDHALLHRHLHLRRAAGIRGAAGSRAHARG